MAKSVFTDPAPGERLYRRLIAEIDREIDHIRKNYDGAAHSGDAKTIRRVNDAILNVESSANQLRSAEVPEALQQRTSDAIKKADEFLAAFATISLPSPAVSNTNDDGGVPDGGENAVKDNDDGTAPLPPVDGGTASLPPTNEDTASAHKSETVSTGIWSSKTKSSRSMSSKHRDAAIANQTARKEHLESTNELEKRKDELAIELKKRELEQQRCESERREQERQLKAIQLEIDAANELEEARIADEADSKSDLSSSHGRTERVNDWVESVSNQSFSSAVATTAQVTAPTVTSTPVTSQWCVPMTTSAPPVVSSLAYVRSSLTPSAVPFRPANPYAFTPAFSTPTPILSFPAPAAAVSPASYAQPFMPTPDHICSWPTNSATQPSQVGQAPSVSQPSFVAQPCPQVQSSPLVPQGPQVPASPVLPPMPTTPGSLLSGDVATSLLTVNLMSHSHELMVQGRPPKDKRFTGATGSDFDSFWNQFQTVTSLEGITDQMRFLELKHWVAGTAAVVLSQYENETDFTEALRRVKGHLKLEFGRKLTTAKHMLEELLSGPQLKVTDVHAVQAFILKLECVYKRAVETNRALNFAAADTYDEILLRKLPFFVHKWAPIHRDHVARQARRDDNLSVELPFSTFVEYLRRQNEINLYRARMRNKPLAPSGGGGGGGGKKSYSTVAATEVSPAATVKSKEPVSAELAITTTSRPKKKSVNPTAKRPNSNKAVKTAPKGPVTAPAKGPVPSSPDPKPGEKPQRPECMACGKGRHDLDYCREFRKKPYEEKRQYVMSNGHCFNCTAKGHLASACPVENQCTKCKGRHNTVLHEDRATNDAPSEQ